MKNTIKIITVNFLIFMIIISSFQISIAMTFHDGDKVRLVKDHECTSLLKFKDSNMMKGVTYVVYYDEETNQKQPAFCVEPEKNGIGTGAGEGYDVTLNLLEDERLWRILYKGFMGSSYQDWNLECEDDLYYATKTAVHSLVQNIAPIDKYEEPNRVGIGENVNLEDVKRRGKAVLEVAQKLYDYGINGEEEYKKARIDIEKLGEDTEEMVDGDKYLVQNYKLVGNRNISNYNAYIYNFPEGSKIVMLNTDSFKVIIPEKNIKDNVEGIIEVTDAKVKTYPVFYANAYSEEFQDYITYASNYEEVNSTAKSFIDSYKSSILVTKIDKDSKEPIPDVEFTLLNSNMKELGIYLTNEEGKILINNLKPGKYYLYESKEKDEYHALEENIELELEWNENVKLEIENEKVDIKVNIEKIGKEEAKAGEVIEYSFKDIKNISDIGLDSLVWTEYLPTDAIKIKKIQTGTWNDEGSYSVWYRTNKNGYKLIADNLDMKVNTEINFEELMLENEEIITEYQVRFENVKINFREIEEPKLFCEVFSNIENGYKFTNKTDIIGIYKGIEAKAESNYNTIVYTPKEPEKILPRTGK